ncbi:uncharacterized protein CC84DRAFT_320513 [Paraphaeosphaeria sporulosa]|uniref:Uncharacterized protein n=1 Tax=Paraphaeosphaeria sporulosa TaxID=1460663 RepID=A0A177BZQ9_9PLEO|nr:uncharacterized protein CC84DRAFT_320513 [Paraphaeosphaeria sporulosa]OAG00646.1 hypothetical protein CC84DRAFT_320513 [Paraphaeosphaeria sporulosa]
MASRNIGVSLMDVPTICFGFTLGFATLTISKAAKQTLSVMRRKNNKFSPYIFMIWIEIVVCLAMAIMSWLWIRGDLPSTLWYFFIQVTLWSIQLQLLLQIIANRISLILPSRSDGRRLRLALFLGILLINISVYCIWIPARLNVSPTWVKLNEVWDRVEKVIYLIVDAGLNAYFLYLVKVRLVDAGLKKYEELWRFNVGISSISISMDLLIIGMMSLPNDLVYVQFHPLSYIVKLNIELCMSDLISKVVRKRDRTDKPHEHDSSSNPSQGTELPSTTTKTGTFGGTTFTRSKLGHTGSKDKDAKSQTVSNVREDSSGPNGEGKEDAESSGDSIHSSSSSDSGINFRVSGDANASGIVREVTVQIEVDSVREGDDEQRSTKSTTILRGGGW